MAPDLGDEAQRYQLLTQMFEEVPQLLDECLARGDQLQALLSQAPCTLARRVRVRERQRGWTFLGQTRLAAGCRRRRHDYSVRLRRTHRHAQARVSNRVSA